MKRLIIAEKMQQDINVNGHLLNLPNIFLVKTTKNNQQRKSYFGLKLLIFSAIYIQSGCDCEVFSGPQSTNRIEIDAICNYEVVE